MAKILSKSGIASLNIVRPGQVSQSIDAFTGIHAYDIYLSGSFNTTGSVTVSGSIASSGNISGSARVFGTHMIATTAIDTPVLENSNGSSVEIKDAITASSDISASGTITMLTASIGGGIFTSASLAAGGGGGGGSTFPFTGDAQITGSLLVTGSNTISGSLLLGQGLFSEDIIKVNNEGFLSTLTGFYYVGNTNNTLQLNGKYLLFDGPGAVTSSVDISSSANIIAKTGSFSHLQGNSPITVGDKITFQQPITSSHNISSSGTITSTTSSHNYIQSSVPSEPIKLDGKDGGVSLHYKDGSDTSLLEISDGITLDIASETTKLTLDSNGIEFKGSINTAITASSNISSSGTVTMATASIGGGTFTSSSLASAVAGGGGGSTFPFTGDAVITGSLLVSGSGQTITGSLLIHSADTPGVRVASNNDNSEEVKIYDAKLTIEDSGANLVTLATNVNSSRLGTLQLANWTSNLVGVYLNGYTSGRYANWIGGALIVGRDYAVGSFLHPVALDVSGSAVVTGSLTVTEDIITSGAISSSGTVTMATASIGGGTFTSASLASAVAGGGGGGSTFPFTGNAAISGALSLTGSLITSGSVTISGSFIPHGTGLTSNVVIGEGAAPVLGIGAAENIVIGKDAGYNVQDGNHNIVIGPSASLSGDVSNQLVIGSGSVSTISASLSTGDLVFGNNVLIEGGGLSIKNKGAQSYARFYCESSNAHYTELKAQPHALYSGNPVTLLPAYDFNFAQPYFQTSITASGDISGSLTSTGSFGRLEMSGEITVPRYIRRTGDADTYVEFLDNKIQLHAGNLPFITADKDAATPYPLTINNGGNRINLRVQDENSDLLLKTNSEEYWVGLYFAGNRKLVTRVDGINITGSLTLSGSGHITASGNISSSGTVSMLTASIGGGTFTSASLASAIAGGGGGGSAFPFEGDAKITGSLVVSSSNSTASLELYGSGSEVLTIAGSEGTLFSVDDDLKETIFSANDISGLPILQASASGEVYLGKSPQSLYKTSMISATSASATQSLCILSTSSYDGAFFDYTVHSASNARAGSIMAVWSASVVSYHETTSSHIGDASGIDFNVIISSSGASLVSVTDSTAPNAWKVKTIIKAI